MTRPSNGWTPSHRATTHDDPQTNPYYGHPTLLAARVILLNWATREAETVLYWGRRIDMRPGDVLCTNESLQGILGLTKKQVRTVIKNLEKIGFLGTTKGTTKGTRGYHLSINNFEQLCGAPKQKGTTKGTTKGTGRAPGGHRYDKETEKQKEQAPAAGFSDGLRIRNLLAKLSTEETPA